ncbi:MAG: polysaccharide biosynthesis protein [Bacteroidetes bacterium]|nr:polysaccharide biosynthesis protein [Bacteroidota bacterium]
MPGHDFKVQATRGFIWNYLYKISEFGLLTLYTILVVRRLGPEVSAPYSIFLAVAIALAMFGAFAVDGVLLRYIQRVVQNSDATVERFDSIETLSLSHFLNTLLSFRLLTITAIGLLVSVVLIVVPFVFPSTSGLFGSLQHEVPLLLVFLYAQAIVAFSTLALTGLLETRRVFVASVVSRLLLIIAGFGLLQFGQITANRAIGVYVGSYIISAAILFASLRSVVRSHVQAQGKTRHMSLKVMGRMIWSLVKAPRQVAVLLATPMMLYGITTWGNDILSMILGKQSDVMVMGVMLGEHSAQIGFYQAASVVLLVTEYVFLFGLGGALTSVFSKLVHDDEHATGGRGYPTLSKARHEIAGSQNVLLIPLCIYVLFFTDTIVAALFGPQFAESTPMIRVGLAALITSVGFFGGGMQITTLVAIGKERLVFRNRLFWGVANMAANIPLIYYFGGMGALIGTQYANLAAVAAEWYFSRSIVGNSTDISGMLHILVASVIATGISYLVLHTPLITVGPWPVAIGGGIINALLVLVLYRLFRVGEVDMLIRRLRSASS